MDSDVKWTLAVRFLTDSLSDDEKATWDEILKQDPVFRESFRKVEAAWQDAAHLPNGPIDADADWRNVLERVRELGNGSNVPNTADNVRRFPVWLKYAATIALLGLTGVYLWFSETPAVESLPASSLTRVEAPVGSKSFVTLPDGSTVWLNAGSKLSFDSGFGIHSRDLHLEGEAFFDVAKQDVPFTVHTAHYDIAVLGTAFNVSAYPDDHQFVTTLVRGSLKVVRNTPDGAKEEILLKPNEQVVFSSQPKPQPAAVASPDPSDEKLVVETAVDVETQTAWKDGWLAMQGESLEELSRKMERLYNIKIEFKEESLKHYRYTGRIRQLSLEQVLKALSLTSPVTFAIDEEKVTLSENKETKSKYQSLQTPRQ